MEWGYEHLQRSTFIIFERMSSVEVEAMLDREEGQVRVKPQFQGPEMPAYTNPLSR